ncbi:hypothetical protein C8P70_10663 [Myroides indicus]|uniref:Uncharacterized protein n=1 Tax=Myroides indicus TaxID=1323422 RepID=A0A4V6Q0S4_9FLAO|nr:hypothetical protein C8P70_10663 [Myroides indicus]
MNFIYYLFVNIYSDDDDYQINSLQDICFLDLLKYFCLLQYY